MRAVIQRVKRASVTINSRRKGEIQNGLLVFLGVGEGDTEKDLEYIEKKTIGLRIFSDENDKMNKNITDVNGSLLVVSQFTLYGDARKGNRPSFTASMEPVKANEMYEQFISDMRKKGVYVQHGEFGADMQVELVNDGPVTILLDSTKIL